MRKAITAITLAAALAITTAAAAVPLSAQRKRTPSGRLLRRRRAKFAAWSIRTPKPKKSSLTGTAAGCMCLAMG